MKQKEKKERKIEKKKEKKNEFFYNNLKHTFEMGLMLHVGPKRIWAE